MASLLRTALVAALYLGAGALCLGLAIPPGYASAIWPPAGLAFAAILAFGYRTWPGVLVGSFLANLIFSTNAAGQILSLDLRLLLSLGIGAGASAQAVVGAYLVRRFVGYPTPLLRERDILAFIALGGPVACLVSSTAGSTLLVGCGAIPGSSLAVNWFSWWVGDSIGVLLAAPIALLWVGRPKRPWRNRRAAVAWPLGVTFVVAVVAFVLVERQERGRIQLEFEKHVAELRESLQATVDADLEQLEAVRGLFNASESVTRDEFAAFAEQAVAMHQAFQSLEWVPRVAAADRAAFEASVRADGLAGFEILEHDEAGGLQAAGARPEYFPVAMLERTLPAALALGFDLGSEAELRAALEDARRTGKPAASRWLVPGDAGSTGNATVLAVPVFEKGPAHLSDAAPVAGVAGFAIGVFGMVDVVELHVAAGDLAGIDIEIAERDAAGAVEKVHFHGAEGRPDFGPGGAPLTGGPVDEGVVELPGRSWLVTGRATLAYLDAHRSSLPGIVQIAGLLFTGLLGAFLLVLSGRAESIAALVRERTAALSRANASLKRAHEEAQNKERQLTSVYENVADAIFLLAVEGEGFRVVSANPAFYADLGREKAEVEGRLLSDAVPARTLDERVARYRQAMREARTIRWEEATELAAHTRYGEASITPIFDGRGTCTSLVGTFHDLTSRHRAEEERQRLESRVQEAQKLESLGSLAGGIAHDMNNVLAAILGLSSALRLKHVDDPVLDKNLGTIERAATRGRDLVRGLLEFARQGLREPRPTDLNDLVRREIEILQRTTLQRVELQIDLAPSLPRVLGEAGSLAGALMNLCVNAVDAMAGGGTLRLSTRRVGPAEVELAVEDTGEGMSPEVKARALEPFFTTKATGKGTGLGLAMVYGTVKAHGGALEIESEIGKGTRVRMTLPAEPDGPHASGSLDARSADAHESGAAPKDEPEPARRHLEVLLVDDDDVVRAAIPRLLEHLGYAVHTAARASEALELLASDLTVDLLILDHNMPGLTGGAALPRIRALRPAVPILMATGFRDAELDALLEDFPDVTILQKPFSLTELDQAIAAVTGRPIASTPASSRA